MNIFNLFTKPKEVKIVTRGAETLRQIKTRYGENIVPLKKAIPPYMLVDKGYGYQGVILYDPIQDKIQCHFCGKWRKQLNNIHLRSHKITTIEYKERYGLYKTTGLNSLGTFLKCSISSKKSWKGNKARKVKLGQLNKDLKQKKGMRMLGKKTAQWKNSIGICDAQLQDRLKRFEKKLGRSLRPSDNNAFTMVLRRRFGNFRKGMEILKSS